MIDDAQLARRLMDRNLIARDHLKQGRQLQMSEGTSLYEVLIRHRLVPERDVVETVAEFLNIPCVHFKERAPTAEAMALLEPGAAQKWRVVPIDMSTGEDGARQLFLGMEDPLDILLLDDLSIHLGIGIIRPVLVGPVDLERQLLHLGAQAPGPELSASGLSEISVSGEIDSNWAAFFDDAQDQDVPKMPSVDISQEMRDRPSTIMLDMMDVEEVLDFPKGASSLEDSVSLLDEPPQSGMPEQDGLEGWDVDESLQSRDPVPPPPPGAPPAPLGHDLFADLMEEMDRDVSLHASVPSGTMLASPGSFAHGLESEGIHQPEDSDVIELQEVVNLEGEDTAKQRVQRARPRTLFGTGLGPSDKEIVLPKSRERIEALRRKMFKTDTPEDPERSGSEILLGAKSAGADLLESKGNSTILLSEAVESRRMVMASSAELAGTRPQGEDLFAAALAEVSGAIPKTPPQADEASSRPVIGRLNLRRPATSGLGEIIEKNSAGLDARAPSEVQESDEALSASRNQTREMREIDIFALHQNQHPMHDGLFQDSLATEHVDMTDLEEAFGLEPQRRTHSTEANEVITAEHLKRMSRGLPEDVSEGSLWRAAIEMLVEQGVLDVEVLTQRARALDGEEED